MPQVHQIVVLHVSEDAEVADRIGRELPGRLLWPVEVREIALTEPAVVRPELVETGGHAVLLVSPALLRRSRLYEPWLPMLGECEVMLLPARLSPEEPAPPLDRLFSVDFSRSFEDGLARLVRFFEMEHEPVARRRADFQLGNAHRMHVLKVVQHCVDRTAFAELLWAAEIDEGRTRGESMHEKLAWLLYDMERQDVGKLELFLRYVEQEHGPCVTRRLAELQGRETASVAQ